MKKEYTTQLELNLSYVNSENTFNQTLEIAKRMNKVQERKKEVDSKHDVPFPFDIGFLMWSPFLWILRKFKRREFLGAGLGSALVVGVFWAIVSIGSESKRLPEEYCGKYIDSFPLERRGIYMNINKDNSWQWVWNGDVIASGTYSARHGASLHGEDAYHLTFDVEYKPSSYTLFDETQTIHLMSEKKHFMLEGTLDGTTSYYLKKFNE